MAMVVTSGHRHWSEKLLHLWGWSQSCPEAELCGVVTCGEEDVDIPSLDGRGIILKGEVLTCIY